MSEAFDYIVVGGGTGGCVVASRLAAKAGMRVLLLEAGGRDRHPFIHIPATFSKVIWAGRDIRFIETEAVPGFGGRRDNIPVGNVLGGGSSVNAMIYSRGNRADYDDWAAAGNDGWSYDAVLPVYRRQEANDRLSDAYHGTSGAIRVSTPKEPHPLSQAFVEAATQSGLPLNPDFNGAEQNGVGYYQATIHRGRRWSMATAFLKTAERSRLEVRTGAKVSGLLVENGHVKGVRLSDGNQLLADGGVVLTAGALETPRLLLVSGIGDADALKSVGVTAIHHLPGVGKNYQNHVEVTAMASINKPISLQGADRGLRALGHAARYALDRGGLLGSNVIEAGGYADTSGDGRPDIQFHVLPMLKGLLPGEGKSAHGISISPCIIRPRSRGEVGIRDAAGSLSVNIGALDSDTDRQALMRGLRLSLEILAAGPLGRLVESVIGLPGPKATDDQLLAYIAGHARGVFHPAGTAKMGPESDPAAVVSPELKVHGLQGLQIADASIMPTIVAGNTNAPTAMIAERAADFILQS